MGLFDLFTSKEKKEKLSHLKSLIALSLADGTVEKSELAAISAVCSREGLTENDLKKCLKNPASIHYEVPKDHNTRLRYLQDMVLLMMSDGNFDKKEMATCKMAAEALGYRPEVIDAMILDIVAEMKRKMENI